MSHVFFFISAVSKEFGSYRTALQHDLDRPNVTVKIQEHFIASGTVTLDKLDEYVTSCSAMIHIIGDRTGEMALAPSVSFIRARYPDMVTRLPALRAALDSEELCRCTQWEAYLALYPALRTTLTIARARMLPPI